jgi:hypothetical protein
VAAPCCERCLGCALGIPDARPPVAAVFGRRASEIQEIPAGHGATGPSARLCGGRPLRSAAGATPGNIAAFSRNASISGASTGHRHRTVIERPVRGSGAKPLSSGWFASRFACIGVVPPPCGSRPAHQLLLARPAKERGRVQELRRRAVAKPRRGTRAPSRRVLLQPSVRWQSGCHEPQRVLRSASSRMAPRNRLPRHAFFSSFRCSKPPLASEQANGPRSTPRERGSISFAMATACDRRSREQGGRCQRS